MYTSRKVWRLRASKAPSGSSETCPYSTGSDPGCAAGHAAPTSSLATTPFMFAFSIVVLFWETLTSVSCLRSSHAHGLLEEPHVVRAGVDQRLQLAAYACVVWPIKPIFHFVRIVF